MTETVVAQPTQQTDLPHYRAFISYRHADVDSAVAEAVQHGLERFWVPKSARGEAGSVHIAPVFRDKEELPVSSRLGDDIEGALRVADALVVICSPRTQESSWVAREIETFLTWHSQDRVFVVLAEGEPYDVIPERLLYETRVTELPDGTTQEEGAGIEPLACDFRNPSRSWRRTELTRLAAAILGVSLKTGEEAFSIQEHSPITACILKGGLLHTVDFEGSATVRYTGGLDSNATFGLANINVGSSEFATMGFADDVPYLLAFDPNANRIHVYRSLRRFTDIAGFESDERFNDMEADTIVQGASDEGNGPAPNYLILKSDEGLTVLRDDSLDPLWSASFEELGVSAMEHSYSGDSVFYYTKASDDKTDLYTIKRVLLDTGEVVSTYEFARDAHHWISIESVGMAHVGNREALVIRGSREISYFSLDTSENLLNIDLEELNAQYAVQTGNTTLVFYVEGDEGRAAVFSLNDGQRIVGTDADSLSIANGYSPEKNVFVSESGLVAVSCADGYLRCLDSSNWEMLWEQRLAGLRTACFSVDGSRLFVQVSSGSCLLLDATTGEMLRSSSVQLPLISGFLYDQDPSTLYGYCLKTGLSRPETSMAIISLSEDTFGPTTVVYSGIFCLPQLNKVIVRDALFEDWGVQQLYSLDELIALANEAIEGHELSEAERQLYRIAR